MPTAKSGRSDSAPKSAVPAPAVTKHDRRRGDAAGPVRTRPPVSDVRIGVVSDTHGYLDPEVLEVFAGVTHIIHAGDIVDPAILEALEALAPVTAVAGNIDDGELAKRLPREVVDEVGGIRFVVGHKRKRLVKRLAAGRIKFGPDDASPDLVVFGHEHVPAATWVEGTLYLNPGTASSPEEEDDEPTVAVVETVPAGLAVRFIPLPRRATP